MQYVKSAKEMAEFLRKANVTDRENFEHEYTLPIIEKASKGTDEERKWANSILNSHYFRFLSSPEVVNYWEICRLNCLVNKRNNSYEEDGRGDNDDNVGDCETCVEFDERDFVQEEYHFEEVQTRHFSEEEEYIYLQVKERCAKEYLIKGTKKTCLHHAFSNCKKFFKKKINRK